MQISTSNIMLIAIHENTAKMNQPLTVFSKLFKVTHKIYLMILYINGNLIKYIHILL